MLTAREQEIAQLIADGYTSREIAAALFLSPFTVQTYRRTIRQKCRSRTTAGAVALLLRDGHIR